MPVELPEFREWSHAAVRLLQGVVEADDSRVWNIMLSNVSTLETYFSRLGLRLLIDESEGFAYLRQLGEDEAPAGYDGLPKLFRSTRLSYGQTLLSVLLRDELRRFEEEETRDERCVVTESELLDQWKAFFPRINDDVKLRRELQAALRKLEELGFTRPFGDDPTTPAWEVRRILKARLTAEELESFLSQLKAASGRRDKQEIS